MPPPVLPEPATESGRAGLAALVARPRTSLIALDFDGTLAPIVDDPADARAGPPTTAVLRRLARVAGTVAIITGRPAADAAEFAGLTTGSDVIVLGHYGAQRWERGELTSPPPPAGLATARAELPGLLAAEGAAAGTFVEGKGYAVAVHTRRTASPQAELDRLTGPLAALADRTGLAMEPGRFVIELRPPGSDKGGALRGLVAERSAEAVMFCGDDVGDRPAFRAVRELRADGIPGLAVCSGSEEVPELAAEADLVVAGPPGVTALLAGLADAFGGD
ncbi:MAG TPA: trehalose-phosphatase [Streptosporangiaceae bacterium]|nr:trehalose-phosphatase [Streptosporangiaceae bacterium]